MSIRASIFGLIVENISKKMYKLSSSKRKNYNRVYEELDRIKDLIVTFPKRRETFERIQILINNIDESIKIDIQNLLQENLLYTHLGRPDLIKFNKWVKRKSKLKEDINKMN